MVTSEEYNQLAQRCARLAIVCSVPSIAGRGRPTKSYSVAEYAAELMARRARR